MTSMRIPVSIGVVLLLAACRSADLHPGAEFRDCAHCMPMIVVPAGRFRMGFDGGEEGRPDGPVRDVTIRRDFALGKYEVTQAEFARFVSDTRREMRGGCQVWQGAWVSPAEADWTNPGYGRLPFDDEPVVCVSWHDAQAYAQWFSRRTGQRYRLPTEAEWEYAARAGTTTDYFWGAGEGDTPCRYANVYDRSGQAKNQFAWAPFDCDDNFGQAAPVGSFAPNGFGLYDMLGNVWEWTADCYQAPYPAAPVDGSAVDSPVACEKRVARGGSWITRPSRQRATFRGRDPADALYSFFGFRLARDL
jgi:formylglycine-generating enzyme required for sulfatase activity